MVVSMIVRPTGLLAPGYPNRLSSDIQETAEGKDAAAACH
jgi:hypothetical protein